MRVRDVMTKGVISCRREDDAAEAARIMWENDCGCVPVVDADGRAVGMVTDRDLCMAAYTRGARLHELSVGSVMSPELFACEEEDAITAAEEVMAAVQVRRLPVLDADRRLVGILSLNDIARARAASRVERAKEHVLGDVAKTLVAIGRPHRERHADESPLFAPD